MGSCLNLLFSILTDVISGFRQLQPTVFFDGKLSESSVFYFDGCNQWFSAIAADILALLGGNGSCFSA